MDKHPDTALMVLDSIFYPQNLSKDQYYTYILLRTQARDKNYKDISSDTLIFQAKDYFSKNGNIDKEILSAFYSGQVLISQGKYKEAMVSFVEARNEAMKTENDKMKGLIESSIGQLYYVQVFYSEAIDKFKSAGSYFDKAGDYKNEISSFILIGNSFMLKTETDSALVYYHRGLALADLYEDTEGRAYFRMNMGIAFDDLGDLSNAKKYLKEAVEYTSDTLLQSRIYCSIADVYNTENKLDSVKYFTNKALDLLKEKEDLHLKINIYRLLSTSEEKKGNFREALEYQHLFSKCQVEILQEKNSQAILDIQKKYDFELIHNAHNKLLIDQQRNIVIILILSLIIIITYFFFYRKTTSDKRAILEAEQMIYQLKDMAKSIDAKEEKSTDEKDNSHLRNVLFHNFDILKKAALLEGFLRDDEKKQGEKLLKRFNEIVYGQDNPDWNLLYRSMNDLEDGFFDRMRETFPQLDDLEFRICCLSYAGLNNTEIGIILKFRVNTIQTKKSAIRKKLGIPGYGNMNDFFNERILKNTSE